VPASLSPLPQGLLQIQIQQVLDDRFACCAQGLLQGLLRVGEWVIRLQRLEAAAAPQP